MFKTCLVFLLLTASLLCAVPSSYNILKLPAGSTVPMNGDMNKWPEAYLIDSLHSDLNVFCRDDALPWTRNEFQMKVYAAWDDANVCFAIKVISDDVYGLCGSSSYSCGCDHIKINPGGQAAGFYIYSNGSVARNPSNPWQLDADLFTGVNSHGGENGLPSYEFSVNRAVMDQGDLRSFQLCVGTEDEDGGPGSCSNECFLGLGVEFLGNKSSFSSQWDNPLYYPTWTLISNQGPALNGPLQISLIPIPSPTVNRKPLFQWHPLLGAASYTIQIDTLGNFLFPLISIPTSDTLFTPFANLPFTSVYWRVKVDQPAVISNTSSFVVQDASIPNLIPYAPNPTNEKRPTLRWHAVSGATFYQIQVAHNSVFAGPDVNVGISDTFFTPPANLAPGTIYWKVNSNLSSKYSATSTFVIQVDTIPLLYTFGGSDVILRRPLFRWKAVTRATTYRIQIDTFKTFSNPIAAIDVADTFFTPLTNLNYRKHYWRVSCNLNSSAYSYTDSLNIVQGAENEQGRELAAPKELVVSPNPFNRSVEIRFANPARNASVIVTDLNGRVIRRQDDLRGNSIRWNADGVPGGIYICQIISGHVKMAKKIILMK